MRSITKNNLRREFWNWQKSQDLVQPNEDTYGELPLITCPESEKRSAQTQNRLNEGPALACGELSTRLCHGKTIEASSTTQSLVTQGRINRSWPQWGLTDLQNPSSEKRNEGRKSTSVHNVCGVSCLCLFLIMELLRPTRDARGKFFWIAARVQVAQTCNPSTWTAAAGELSEACGQPGPVVSSKEKGREAKERKAWRRRWGARS